MKGRKPVPSKLNAIRGNPGKRPPKKNEPKPSVPVQVPKAPEYFGKLARGKWELIVEEVYNLGLLTTLDIDALAQYCLMYESFLLSYEDVKENGSVLVDNKGNKVKNPAYKNLIDANDRLLKLAAEFGFTPSSRNRVSTVEKEVVDPLDDFLENGCKPYAIK